MKVSELSESTGVSVPTIKYYLREKLLMPGVSRGATQADYCDEHVRRVRLIRSLTDVAGLPIQKVRVILATIEHPGNDLFEALGRALTALPPYIDEHATDAQVATADTDAVVKYPRAKAALDAIGQAYDPEFTAVAQFEQTLAAVDDAGIPMTAARLAVYAEHLRALAEYDLSMMPTDSPQSAVEYAVLGTALYEPVVVAMRRLAHRELASRMLAPTDE